MPEIPPEAVMAAAIAIERELLSGRDYSMAQDSDEALARVALEAAAPILAEAWGVTGNRRQRAPRRPPESVIAALRALAASPEGLPTPKVAPYARKAATDCFTLLRKQELRGLVVRVNSTGRGPVAHVWQITDEGHAFLAALTPEGSREAENDSAPAGAVKEDGGHGTGQ